MPRLPIRPAAVARIDPTHPPENLALVLLDTTRRGDASMRLAVERAGWTMRTAGDPFELMRLVVQHRAGLRAVILSVAGLAPREAPLVAALRRAAPGIMTILTHLPDDEPGRRLLAEMMAQGIDAVLLDGQIQSLATHAPEPRASVARPVLSARELRALLDLEDD
jgi:hypothetical protein